jgi:hypothetical protein
MANAIQIKRRSSGGSAGAPSASSLKWGELAFNEADNILYYGYGSGNNQSSSVTEIGGSGYFAHRGGTNASGLWPIAVTGNAGTVTNGVYTTGNQVLSGTPVFSGGIDVKTSNTSTVSYIAVFDGADPTENAVALQSISTSDFLNDVNTNVQTYLLSGIFVNAGSGLQGGGSIDNSITLDIGQGDGISVSDNSIAVNNTVVRTTGNQTIEGTKTFSSTISGSIDGNAASVTNGVYTNGSYTDPSWLTITKSKVGLGNVTNDAQVKKLSTSTDGYVPTWNGTTGDALNNGYSVETTLTGGSSALPRADAVKTYIDNAFGANDAMVFKGTLGTGGTITALPTTYSAGWAYRVITAGTYAGVACEIGDLIIAIVDRSGSGNQNSDWTVVQTNLDGAVIGPASSVSNNFALFDGTTGKLIKDAGFSFTTVGQNLITLSNPSSISFLKVNANNTVTARSAADFKTDLSLNNVENTALSTWAGSTNITTLGTITAGTWNANTIAVNKGGTGQTSYTNGQLLIGNTAGNTLAKATLTEGTSIAITNGAGSITIAHADTSTLTGAQGGNGIAGFTIDGLGHITAVTTATYLTAGTVCAAIVNCGIDGGTF